MDKSEFGVIGLDTPGRGLALNIINKGHSLSVYNRSKTGEETYVSDFINTCSKSDVKGFNALPFFIASLEKPRKILLMVQTGAEVDHLADSLALLLSTGDIIIDGGNSHFEDTRKRTEKLAEHGIHFVGCGISGGEAGSQNGPSLMPGGNRESYAIISPVLESIAAKDKTGKPCCTYIGPDGAGHFTKMIHNGIEYAEMQVLAEVYQLLKQNHSNDEIADIFDAWNQGDLSSYLLQITITILRKKERNTDLIDLILDKATNESTSAWSSQAALDLQMPTTLMSEAVFARYISGFKDIRTKLDQGDSRSNELSISVDSIKNAYRFARIINHQQGFSLLAKASSQYQWQLNLSEIARIWSNGCIIRSSFMERLVEILKLPDQSFDQHDQMLHLLQKLFQPLKVLEQTVSKTITKSNTAGIALPAMSSSYQYWLGMTTAHSTANLIQAQRDYFGAHSYQRTDEDESRTFHTQWGP